MPVTQVNSLDEYQTKTKTGIVVVDFFADWCGPCKAVAPHFHKLSTTHEDVTFLQVDVVKASDVSNHENIACMPTFKIYKDGNLMSEIKGTKIKEVEEVIQKLKS